MADERIDSYIDRNGVRQDTDFIVTALREVYGEFQKLQSVKVDLKGVSGLASLTPTMTQAKAAADSLAVATKAVEERVAAYNGKSKEFTTVLLQQTKAQKEAAQASLAQAKANTENAKAKEIETRITKSLNKEIEASNKAREREQRNLEKLNNEYEQLKAKYLIAANTAKQLAAAKGLDNEETKEAIAQAQMYYKTLLNIEQAVGQSQRQVGNYTQATFALTQVLREAPAFANSFATGISAIGNNVPLLVDQFKILRAELGSGFKAFKILAGGLLSFQALLPLGFLLIQSYSDEIASFFKNLFSGSKALDEAARRQKVFNEVTKEAAISYAKERVELEANKKALESANVSRAEKQKIIKTLQEQYPGYFKNLDIESGKVVGLSEDYNTLIKVIGLKARATAAANLLAKQEEELLQQGFEFGITSEEQGRALLAELEQRDDLYSTLLANKGREILERRVFLEGIQAEAEEALRALQAGRNTDKPDPVEGDKSLKDAKRLADERLKIVFETQQIELQRIIDFNKALAENEDANLQDRLQAVRDGLAISIDLINRRYDTEKIIGKKTAEELKLIETQRNDDLIRAKLAYEKQLTDIQADEQKLRDEDTKLAAEKTEQIIDFELNQWLKKEKEKTKIADEENKKRQKSDEEYAKNRRRLEEDLTRELTTLTFSLFTANLDRQKNALQDQIDLLEEQKQKDIEVANQTIANTQERAAAIQVIEARAAAQREQLQRRQRDFDIRKAQFDRAQAIANIVQETAKNVVEYFGTPLALLAAAIGAAQIAAVVAQPIPRFKHGKNVPGSMGGDSYEGPALVDDGGKPEAVIREDGTVEVGGNKPRLTYLKKRDVVLPDANMLVDYVLAGHMGGRLAVKPAPGADPAGIHRIEKGLKNVETAIRAQPRLNLSASDRGMTAIWQWGANQTQYLNDNTNW